MAIYIFPNDNVNIFNPNPAHLKAFADIQTSLNKEYEPIEPLPTARASFFVQKLKTADEVEQALQEIRAPNRAEIERKAQQVYARIDSAMRSNPQEMLQLIADHPRAFSLIAPSLHTQDFYLKALEQNHRVYDLLPKHMQQNQTIIDKYRECVFKHPAQVRASAATSGWDAMHYTRLRIPVISPKCPIEKFATVDAYRTVMYQAFRYDGMSRTIATDMSRENLEFCLGETTGAALTLRRLAPHLQQEFAQVEKEAYQHEQKAFFAGASIAEHSEQYQTMKNFTEKHNLPDVRNEYMTAAWHNHCRYKTNREQLPAASTIKTILERCPKEIAQQYFDLQTGELPSSHPAIIAAEKKAIELQRQMEQEPNANYDKEILGMIKAGPVSVVKAHIDFEGYIRQAARREECTLAGEIIAPLKSHRDEDKTYAVETALRDQKKASEQFFKALHDYPEYEAIYREELDNLQKKREVFTPDIENLRFTQQWAYEYPEGTRQLDHAIIQCLQNYSPELCSQHLDAKGYLERRTEYFKDSHMMNRASAAEQFKLLISQSPAASAIVENKLLQLGIQNPSEWLKTPLTQYAFSQDTTPTTRHHSPEISRETMQELETSGPKR